MLEWTVVEQNVMKEGFHVSKVFCVTLSEGENFIIPPNRQRLENYLLIETSRLHTITKKHNANFLMHIPFFENKEDAENFKNEIIPLWESAQKNKSIIDEKGTLYDYYSVYSLETKLFESAYKNHLANAYSMDFVHLQYLSSDERSERHATFSEFSSDYELVHDKVLKEFIIDVVLEFVSTDTDFSPFMNDFYIRKETFEEEEPVYSVLVAHQKK